MRSRIYIQKLFYLYISSETFYELIKDVRYERGSVNVLEVQLGLFCKLLMNFMQICNSMQHFLENSKSFFFCRNLIFVSESINEFEF